MALAHPVPDVVSLDVLVSVGRLGSISEAATAHGMTQPAASMRLRDLERVLGVSLLERTTRGSRLTPAGVATVEWAGKVLEDLRSLQAATNALRQDARSQLRLAASMTVAEYLIPGWLQRLHHDAPDIAVSLHMDNSSDVMERVSRGQVDLGFVEGAELPQRLRAQTICDDTLLVVVGASHPWSRRRHPLSPSQLAAAPLLVREAGSGTREVLANALAAHGLTLTPLLELGSTTAIKAAATAGTGPAVLSRLAVESDVASGALVVIPCRDLDLHRQIRAVWPDGRRRSPASERLLEIVTAAWAGSVVP